MQEKIPSSMPWNRHQSIGGNPAHLESGGGQDMGVQQKYWNHIS